MEPRINVMATCKLYLDTRRPSKDGLCPLKLLLTQNRKVAYVTLKARLLPSQWDASKLQVIKHDDVYRLNAYIGNCKRKVDQMLLTLADEGRISSVSVNELKSMAEIRLDPEKYEQEQRKNLFENRCIHVANTKSENNRKFYMRVLENVREFCSSEGYKGKPISDLSFEDINKDWLVNFDKYFEKRLCQNSRALVLRTLRAVFNDAIDNEITTSYPFRKFKIKQEPTRKRSLSVEDLRTLFNYPVEEYAVKHLDMFKLMFMLIGINPVDLCHLKEIVNGRIEYNRAKTHKLYSIKVEPEALEIINKYRGKNWLIYALDQHKDYHDFAHRMGVALKKIGPMERVGRGGKKIFHPLFPDISAYWARHTWATIAADLDIPMETISHALGHSFGCETTAIYINFNNRKVDEANRKVLDWVLYGKR